MDQTNNQMENRMENGIIEPVGTEDGDMVEEALQGLVQAVWESPEYKRYHAICNKVHAYPELEQQIHAFRRKNYETQNTREEWELYERMDELEREGAEFRKDPLVDEYLTAELAFCRLFQKINWTLVRNMGFELGFTID